MHELACPARFTANVCAPCTTTKPARRAGRTEHCLTVCIKARCTNLTRSEVVAVNIGSSRWTLAELGTFNGFLFQRAIVAAEYIVTLEGPSCVHVPCQKACCAGDIYVGPVGDAVHCRIPGGCGVRGVGCGRPHLPE